MTEITAEHIETISMGLSVNRAVLVLTLSCNNIRSKGTAVLLASLLTSRVMELHLASNHLKDDVGPHVASLLAENQTLKHLDLSGNSLTQRFAQTIAIPLSTGDCHLVSLNLSRNPLGGRGIAAIGPAMATNRSLLKLNVSACKIQSSGFAEFCHSLEKNSTLQTLIVEHNAIRDEGAIALADVIAEHPVLRSLNIELCEIADEGARALFDVIKDSKSIRKVTLKNNLIRDGLCIQKAIAANTQIYLLNIDYNDIPFKLFSEIQKQVATNYRIWKNGQEIKTEEELEMMRRVQADLRTCRDSIVSERILVNQRKDQVAALRAELQRLEEAKLARLTKLEDAVAEITKRANDSYLGYREETDRQGAEVAATEAEIAQLQMKVARESDRYRAEIKNLSTTERLIGDGRMANLQELEALAEKRAEAKQKYQSNAQMLESSFQIAKMPRLEDLVDVPADGDDKPKKGKSKPKAKKPAKGKGKEEPPPPDKPPEEGAAA
jgi:Ran GTPase-activating protein (RanGAP) involved in mRNA processing and transport